MEMNSHVHSGQTSGQMLNQASSMLSGVPQQNGIPLPSHVQNLVGRQNTLNMEPDLLKFRRFMQQKIYEYITQRHQQGNGNPPTRVLDMVKRLEEGLFRNASTKEEYMNLETLGSRLQIYTRHLPLNNHEQFPQHVSSSSSICTMIPTPCMPQNGNSSFAVSASVDTSTITTNAGSSLPSTTIDTGNFLPAGVGASGGIQGPSSNGYQYYPSNFSISSSGSNSVSSMAAQRMMGQMIPTPGLNRKDIPSGNDSRFSIVESNRLAQPAQQKQHVGGQNSRILHNVGSHVAGALRSGLQHKLYASSNGALSGGLRMASDLQLLNGSESSEGYSTAAAYGNLPKPLQQHYDQHQRSIMQGDRYGMSPTGSSGSGSLYVPVTSAGSMMSNQNMNSVNLGVSKTDTDPITNEWNSRNILHAADTKSQLVDQQEKMNFQSSLTLRENLVQSHQEQLQQQSHFQQEQQIRQQQLLLQNDTYVQPQQTYNADSKIKSEAGMDFHDDSLHTQVSYQFHVSDMQNQFQLNPVDDHSRSTHLLSPQSGLEGFSASMPQDSLQMQPLLHQQQFVAAQNDFSHFPTSVKSEAVQQGQWYHKSQEGSHIPGDLSKEPNVINEFGHRITMQDEALRTKLRSPGSISCPNVAAITAQRSSGATCGSSNLNRVRDFRNQQRWLLFLRHARSCPSPEGKRVEINCIKAQQLLRHMDRCNAAQCTDPRCHHTKNLIDHHKNCRDPSCPVCIPVKKYLFAQMKVSARTDSNSQITGSCKSNDIKETAGFLSSNLNKPVVENSKDLQASLKRMKIEQLSQSLAPVSENSVLSVPAPREPSSFQNFKCDDVLLADPCIPGKFEPAEVKMEIHSSSKQGSPIIISRMDNTDDAFIQGPENDPILSNDPAGINKPEVFKIEKEMVEAKQENVAPAIESAGGTKSGKPKIKGVSLIELFTPEQVREHISSLRKWVGQSRAKAEKNQLMGHSMNENSCQLCAVEKLNFDPPPMYCTPCGARIKRNAMYYTIGAGDARHYFCIPCYNEARGDTIMVDGTTLPKVRLEKKRNDEETEEWWVQCDKCEAWQHQICALFNGRRNDGGQAEYTCPNCYTTEIERGERKPLPQSAVLGAKDLPRTILSDHIEQRLFRRLKHERQERARLQGKSYDEVPGAEALVVRVVSSVDKKLEVKQRFLEIFQEDNYPTEFPYKSKVVLLFQKIEGVEVCLFGMYVQEFGSECQQPNHRRVYLSYLDSVKYFRPEIKAVTGEALRTFVYHEILIAYLEYCKKRGFTSCYIWACPPLKGEDYILYCHPEIQKTPKSDKLREWYLSMLRKAGKEGVVVGLTNLYDHFFLSNGECKAKVTAARLPYFDGDYWPGAAEDIIYQILQEEDGRKFHKKGITKKLITKRALKASGQTDLSGNASKDLLLMHKLGETISPMKEDFIMVHLQHACTHCCILMISGNRWVCRQCKNFQICDKCYEAEQKLEEREKHPINQRDKHVLYPEEIRDVAAETKDKDDILESEFFDTRQAFLSLCQGNHYQYDTLRRAKHSSMMVLYHLHNPTAPAFVTTCNMCNLDIEAGQGWRCEICPDYDVCNVCYQKDGGIDHPHKLTNHLSLADRDAQNKEARQLRVVQLRKMLDLLVHASQCRSPQCQYPNCRKVKGLFRHGIQCKTRASGGCVLCNKMWYLLKLHARACKESECSVPRCRDLKEHLRRFQQQSDSRRRAAVMEMMRQRAAEVAGNA